MKINNAIEWKEIKAQYAGEKDLIIFKFSPICLISRNVENLFDNWISEINDSNIIKMVKIDVIESRSLSSFIAEELNIKHQSPQLIWLDKNQNVKWHGSHYEISVSKLNANLAL